jgi:solute carrier family 25 (mitochondrial 2-oxodicarboxylate transporter), member 21
MEAPKRATKFAANDEWGKFYRKGKLPRLRRHGVLLTTMQPSARTRCHRVSVYLLALLRERLRASCMNRPLGFPRSTRYTYETQRRAL